MSESIRHDHSVDAAWDFYGCDLTALADPGLAEGLHADIIAAGFTPACENPAYLFRRFDGGGVSFGELLMESHAVIHGSPENSSVVEVTIHSCYIVGLDDYRKTPKEKTKDLYELWRRRLKPTRVVPMGARIRASAQSVIYGISSSRKRREPKLAQVR